MPKPLRATQKKSSVKTKIKSKETARPKLQLNEINAKIVDMLNRHSPLDLTFSSVSRWTKVPRSTLYYYYGNSREKMIEAAVTAAVKSFMRLGDALNYRQFSSWDEYQIYLLTSAAKVVEKFPWAPDLYFKYRMDAGYIGQSTRDLETHYFKERTEAWSYFNTGHTPEWPSVKIVSVLKLATLYALQIDPDLWRGEANTARREKLISMMTQFIHQLYKTEWDS